MRLQDKILQAVCPVQSHSLRHVLSDPVRYCCLAACLHGTLPLSCMQLAAWPVQPVKAHHHTLSRMSHSWIPHVWPPKPHAHTFQLIPRTSAVASSPCSDLLEITTTKSRRHQLASLGLPSISPSCIQLNIFPVAGAGPVQAVGLGVRAPERDPQRDEQAQAAQAGQRGPAARLGRPPSPHAGRHAPQRRHSAGAAASFARVLIMLS